MADITLCTNKTCQLRGTCKRYLQVPDPHWQSYADFKPDGNGDCEHYWEWKQ